MRWVLAGMISGTVVGLMLLAVGLMACAAARARGRRDHPDCAPSRILGMGACGALMGFASGCLIGWMMDQAG